MPSDASRLARLSERVYAAALALLPNELRRRHGSEMREDFAAVAGSTRARQGRWAVVRLLVRCVADSVAQAVSERVGRAPPDAATIGKRTRNSGERIMGWWQEVRLGARSLAKKPGFAGIAVSTLGLGIGATAAIFAVVNAVLIRPLPYPESERVVWFGHHAPGLDLPELRNSEGTIALYERHARSFTHVAAVDGAARNLTGGTEPARVQIAAVTPTLFDVLAVGPLLGRRLVDADAEPGAPSVAVLTHSGWTTHFGRRPDAIGQTIELSGVRTEVVGVLPPAFAYPETETALLIPRPRTDDPVFGSFGITGIARLAPGVSLEAARVEVTGLQDRLLEMYDDLTPGFFEQARWSATVESLRDRTVGDVETALWIVLGTVGFLLLVACASVANLLLVRAESRQREVGIRFALGATRTRVASSFLAESVLLAAAGGALGMLLAWIGVRALVATAHPQLPRLAEVSVDTAVLAFVAGISLLAGLIFGLMPLPQQLRAPLLSLMREGRGQTASGESQRVRKLLIVGQIALSLVLLTGSGLMLRSFDRLRSVDLGIRPAGLLAVGVSIGENADRPAAASTYGRMLDQIRALPGVQAAAATNVLPLAPDNANGGSLAIESRPTADDQLPPVAMYSSVSDDYFEAMGTRLLRGRPMERGDSDHRRNLAWVNETFERTFLDGSAIGERIRFGDDTTWLEIAGVVGDVHTFDLREAVRPQAYFPLNTTVSSARIGMVHFVVRTTGDPMALASAVRAAVRRVEPSLPLTTARTMESVVNGSLADTSFTLAVLTVAATVSLLLGAIGLYGVIGYVVSQRTKEIGVRIALGAVPSTVRQMVLRQGLTLALVGLAVGLAASAGLTRLLESLLFGVSARDPITFVLVPAVLLAVAALAAYVPAARAARIDPVHALRAE